MNISTPRRISLLVRTFAVFAIAGLFAISAVQSIVIVNAAIDPGLTWANPADIVYGTALSGTQLNATANVPGNFVYTPAAGTVLTAGSHQLSVTFTPTDAVNYSNASTNVNINVTAAVLTIGGSFTASGKTYDGNNTATIASNSLSLNGNIVSGDVVTLSAIATFADPNAGTGKTVSLLASTLGGAAASNYLPSFTGAPTAMADISKAAPAITWATPADIVYGTALSGTQLNATANVPGTFVYNPAAGTVLNVGTGQVLNVIFTPTDATNYNGATASVNINVTKAATVISWANPADIVYGTALSGTQLNATANVPGNFVYTPAAGTVLTAGSHQLSVTFTPTDAVNYSNASTNVNINVTAAVLTIGGSFTASGKTYDGNNTATIASNSLSLNGNIVSGDVVTLSAIATFADPNAGTGKTVSLLASTLGGAAASNYLPSFTGAPTAMADISKAAPAITWATPADIVYGTALSGTQLNATANVPGTFVYNPAAGTVLNVGTGQVLNVIFTPTDATNYNGATASVNINVTKAATVISWANPADIVYGTALSGTQLNATANVPGNFVYTPAAGTVLTAGSHQLSVTFTPTDAVNYSNASTNVNINVTAAVLTIGGSFTASGKTYDGNNTATIASNSLSLNGNIVSGDVVTLSAIATFADPNAGTGKTVSLLASTLGGAAASNYLPSFTGAPTAMADISKAAPAITWATPADIVYGTALSGTQLNATANVPGTFVYNPAAGTVLNVGTGQVLNVIFTPTDATNYNGATASVNINVTKAATVISWANPADIVYGTALSGTQLNATANVPGNFVYTPAAGTVLTAGSHQLSVTFTPTDAVNYSNASTNVNINVTAAVLTIGGSFTASGKTYDGNNTATIASNSLSLNGNIVSGDVVTLSAIATFADPNAGTGKTVSLLASTLGGAAASNYLPSFTGAPTAMADISKAAPAITWATPADIVYGTALSGTQLNATANVPGTFVYNPAAGTVLNVGTGQVLNVIFTPTDATNYNGATASVNINVTKAATVISWANPADIVYGTALSGTQLNATANVPGNFVYTPAAGTVLTAGSHQLSVTFTPTDATNYATATSTVTLNITKVSVTPSVTAANKNYDNTTTATIISRTLTGVIAGDMGTVALSGGIANFDTSAIGTSKTVTVTGLSLSGINAGNYVLSSTTATTNADVTPAPAGGGGGGGGFGSQLVGINLSGTSPFMDGNGKSVTAGTISTPDGNLTLNIPTGVFIWNAAGAAQPFVSASVLATPPQAPSQHTVLLCYELGPVGVTFNPSITLIMTYDDGMIPIGAKESDLDIGWWDGIKWVELTSIVDVTANTVTAQVSHFTDFALLVPVSSPLPQPTVEITAPITGVSLEPGNITLSIKVENLTLIPVDKPNSNGEGKVVYYIDVDIPTTPGKAAFTALGTYTETNATSNTWSNLALGNHSMGVQLVQNDNTPFNPPITATIGITIKAAAVEPIPTSEPAQTQPIRSPIDPIKTHWIIPVAFLGVDLVLAIFWYWRSHRSSGRLKYTNR